MGQLVIVRDFKNKKISKKSNFLISYKKSKTTLEMTRFIDMQRCTEAEVICVRGTMYKTKEQ